MWTGVLSVPNAITFARLCVLPWFLYLLFVQNQRAGAALLLGVLGMTDWVDGWLARKFNQVSPFGSVFDPTVDRVLFVVAAISVLIDGAVPQWFCIAILVREVVVGGMMLGATLLGMERFPVTRLGKWATFALMAAVPWVTLGSAGGAWSVFTYMGWAVGIPGVFVSYKSFFQYLPTVRSHLASGRRS